MSNFVLQSLIDPKPCPFFPGHTLWATFRFIHALHILPWSHFPRPLTNRSRQSRFQHWQWSRRNLVCGARILKILVPKTMYCLWETCLPHESRDSTYLYRPRFLKSEHRRPSYVGTTANVGTCSACSYWSVASESGTRVDYGGHV